MPNLWASFTAAQTRILRWSAYAAGALAGLLDHRITENAARRRQLGPRLDDRPDREPRAAVRRPGRRHAAAAGPPAWSRPCTSSRWCCRPRSTLALFGVANFAPAGTPLLPEAITAARLYILPATGLAVIALALTTPTVVRLLRRTLFG